jgi:hypothetical protein
MFPIEGENNKRWENISTIIFLTESSITPKIQRHSRTVQKQLKPKTWCFPYATYLFVKSSVRENKSYVKSVTNYLKEYDEWYIEAEQK